MAGVHNALRRARRTLAVVVACLTALASLGALPLGAGASPLSPSAPGTPAAFGGFSPYPGGDVTLMAVSNSITAGSCTYAQAIDDPHISSTAPLAASVHGWWQAISGTCPSLANIDTYLEGFWCDQFGCRWIQVAYSSGDIGPGGGSGARVTARRTCSSSSTLVGWRGHVDVDLIGVSDPPGFTYSNIVNLYCVP